MILVDSSVWIDFFRNKPTRQAEWLDRNLGVEGLVLGDLILAEGIQGRQGLQRSQTPAGTTAAGCSWRF